MYSVFVPGGGDGQDLRCHVRQGHADPAQLALPARQRGRRFWAERRILHGELLIRRFWGGNEACQKPDAVAFELPYKKGQQEGGSPVNGRGRKRQAGSHHRIVGCLLPHDSTVSLSNAG